MSMGARGSNGRTSNQDYSNLLFSDSESDSRIPDLKLPPVKGKRQKKKRGSSGYRPEETSCGLGSLMKVFLLLVLFTVVAALGGISFWSMQKISSLQEKVDRLEQSEAFTPDSMTKLQTQLASLNKSLTALRLGAGGMKASIEKLESKVKSLEDKNVELSKAVASSKDVLDLPVKFNGLADVVANLHAAAIISKQEELENKLSALENDFKTLKRPDQDETNGEAKPDDQALNHTIAALQSRLDQQETKMSTLEEFIHKPHTSSPVSPSLIDEQVKGAMQEYMSNMTFSSALPSGELNGVLQQVSEIVKSMDEFKKIDQENTVTKGEFLVFKLDVTNAIKNVNESLNAELVEVSNHFEMLDSYVQNFTSFIQVVGSEIANDNGGETGIIAEPTPAADERTIMKPSMSSAMSDQSDSSLSGLETHLEDKKETNPTAPATTSTSSGKSSVGAPAEIIPTENIDDVHMTEKPSDEMTTKRSGPEVTDATPSTSSEWKPNSGDEN